MENIRIKYINKMTVNIGNFQNLQPEYGIEADITASELDDAFAKIKRKVDALLEADVDEILKEKSA